MGASAGLELKAENFLKRQKSKKRRVSDSCRELVGNGGFQGKQLELGETGGDMARSSAALSLLFSAPVRCVGISHSSYLTSAAD